MSKSSQATLDLTGQYVVSSAHSQISFVARTMMITRVRGLFADFTGSARIADDPAGSSVTITIQADSISTDHDRRDERVRGTDFLDVANYPEIRFRSTVIERLADSGYRVTGDLTVRDITRSHTVDFIPTGVVRDPTGTVLAGFSGATTIDRRDFGITANVTLDAGGVMLSNEIGLEFEIGATQEV